jgi:hypothetical protein
MRANFIFSKFLPLMPVRFSSLFFVSEKGSPYVMSACSASHQMHQCILGSHLFQEKLERYAVYAARVRLEMLNLDEISLVGAEFLVGDALRDHIRVVVDTENRVTGRELSEELVVVNLVDSYATALLLI